eukprot:9477111-Prorocentrum_lima.AAC.1
MGVAIRRSHGGTRGVGLVLVVLPVVVFWLCLRVRADGAVCLRVRSLALSGLVADAALSSLSP